MRLTTKRSSLMVDVTMYHLLLSPLAISLKNRVLSTLPIDPLENRENSAEVEMFDKEVFIFKMNGNFDFLPVWVNGLTNSKQ